MGLACAYLLIAAGCSTYQIGNQSLYRPDIRTIHVPVFASDSYRRNLGELLTEAVVKEIELITPYKVVAAAEADSILQGRLLTDTKRVLAEDQFDVPRDIEADLTVQLSWTTRQGDVLLQSVALPLPPVLQIHQAAHLVPEGGPSVATAHQRAVTLLAKQIVSQMEYPW